MSDVKASCYIFGEYGSINSAELRDLAFHHQAMVSCVCFCSREQLHIPDALTVDMQPSSTNSEPEHNSSIMEDLLQSFVPLHDPCHGRQYSFSFLLQLHSPLTAATGQNRSARERVVQHPLQDTLMAEEGSETDGSETVRNDCDREPK